METSSKCNSTLEQLVPSAGRPEIRSIIVSNAANKAAGKQLLHKLPLQDKLLARFRSWMLLLTIYATFWLSVFGTAVFTLFSKAWQLLSSSGNGSSSTSMTKPATASANHNNHLRANGYGAPSRSSASAPIAAQLAEAPAGMSTRSSPGTVLVTGGKMTKALHVCRHLHQAGWRVLLLETHKYWHVGSRFSSAVDAFYTVPVPEDEPAEYVREILSIAAREGVTMFIPVSSPISSLYDAMTAEALQAQATAQGRTCRCWTLSAATTALLDNKASFSDYARSLGLTVPDHFVVKSVPELLQLNMKQVYQSGKTFVLKNLSYDSVHRADLVKLPCPQHKLVAYVTRPDVIISEQQPWILQEFIRGREYSSYSLAADGHLVAHSDTLAELSNLNFAHQGHPGIQQWVQDFVARTNASGQLCFDFMESAADGKLYCIECNPRTSSVITEFHDNPALATAFAAPNTVTGVITPYKSSRPAYWLWNELARLVTNPGYLPKFLQVMVRGTDAVYQSDDPLPFIGLHYLQIPVLLAGNLIRGNPWKKVDLCIGKIAELYGD